MPKKIFVILVALLTIAVSAGCSREATPPAQTAEIHLIAHDIKWDIEMIETEVGQPLLLVITNEGLLDHNFEIVELGVNENIAPGETIELELIFDHAGVFDFICNVPGHAEAGMVGKIIVSE